MLRAFRNAVLAPVIRSTRAPSGLALSGWGGRLLVYSEIMTTIALQDRYAPHSRCFGCGPANDKGLRIKSIVHGDEVVADFVPEAHHEAFPGMVNGGIVGALLDCHSNWTSAHALMLARQESTPPCTVTADFHVRLKRPTPLDGTKLQLRARVVSIEGHKVVVSASLEANGKVCATCDGTFVAVEEGHPAYHRW